MSENLESHDELVCSECGRVLEEDQGREFDGRLLCDDCYRGGTVLCDHCGNRVWREDSEGDGDRVLCFHCYSNYFTTCDGCGLLIPNDEAYYDGDDDERYCRECFYKKRSIPIKPYNHKPDPIFFGTDSSLFLGVELEIDGGGEYNDNAEQILSVANSTEERLYCKHDGSLCDGFELVSHPMTLEYHRDKMNWKSVFDEAISLDYLSHCTDTCGLHVHVNREYFGELPSEQEACVGRIVFFVEKHWDDLVRFSRRKSANLNRWAARYSTISPTAKETYKKAKDSRAGRYVAVNLTNYDTVEFRFFRGSLRYETFIASLQLVALICELARSCTDRDFEEMSWRDFVLRVDREHMPELIAYLKIRQLYVNELSDAVEQEV